MSLNEVIEKRSKLIERLLKALEHLSREQQFSILTAQLSLVEMEDLVAFQERH